MFEVNPHFIDYREQIKRSWGNSTQKCSWHQGFWSQPTVMIATTGHTACYFDNKQPPSGKTNTFIEYIWSIHYIGQWIKTLAHIMYSSQQRNLYFTTVSYVWKIYDLTTLWLYNGSIKTIHIIAWRILDKLKQTMSTRFKNSSKLSCLLDGMLHVFKHT